MIRRQNTAGTAGDGYRVEPVEHDYQPGAVDHDERPRCRCGRERGEHQPARRSA